ncbi:hypothetical protein BSL82_00085 [Tardibacter chloracetimidivorans]|uniref:PD-(D/E)XK motif protein n=1 Tax=Tardibacter chloracetimidivorans TaxID=1921510 RepID=A0A1L3ZQK5_9SPHN|nr:hypothetical protein BSL82_00085 [Tardibacter chloracetimidivorans]
MTPQQLASLWQDLGGAARSASGMNRRRLDADAAVDVYACVFWPRGRPGLLVEGAVQVAGLADRTPRCRGVRVMHDVIAADGRPDRTVLVVMLDDDRLREIFAVLSADLVNAVTAELTVSEGLRRCIDRLCMWQGLFERIAPEGLSPERQRGLLGELLALEGLFLAAIEPLRAVSSWFGSDSAHQDFVHMGVAVEVKTTLAKRHARIMIANEKQLDERPYSRLILAVIKLDERAENGVTLPQQIARIRTALLTDPLAAKTFDDRLLLADYLDVHSPLYETRYHAQTPLLFSVEGNFPRLTEANLPAGVGDIRYSIIADDLNAYALEPAEVTALIEGQA